VKNKFSQYVIERLQHYVYRLIDPRTGQTFYVSRGVGNRVFAHVNDELKAEADSLSDKLRITEMESVYAAVRCAWVIDPQRAQKADIVLALQQGVVVGVFIAERWMKATVANFPSMAADVPGRWGFVGHEAPAEIRDQYLRHRLPDSLRRRGAANPVRYVNP
jgi:hypothetical protein